jgi:hypothetical protein
MEPDAMMAIYKGRREWGTANCVEAQKGKFGTKRAEIRESWKKFSTKELLYVQSSTNILMIRTRRNYICNLGSNYDRQENFIQMFGM